MNFIHKVPLDPSKWINRIIYISGHGKRKKNSKTLNKIKINCNLKTSSVEMACLLVIYIKIKEGVMNRIPKKMTSVSATSFECALISFLVFFNFSSQHFVIAFEYLNCCGIFEEFQLEFHSQKQQASSVVFENAFKVHMF